MKIYWLSISACLCSSALAASPFDGTWSLDRDKTKPTGTFSFQKAAIGALKYSDPQESYTVRLNGTPVTTPLGEEVSMHQTGERSYAFVSKRNGKLQTDEHWEVSADERNLTIDWQTFAPDGKTYHSKEIDERTAPGAGLAGTWKIVKLDTDRSDAVVIRSADGGRVIIGSKTNQTTLSARWDGRDYRPDGPLIPAGATIALSEVGPQEFKMTSKLNGAIVAVTDYRLAADGRTMASESRDGKGHLLVRQVWLKQP